MHTLVCEGCGITFQRMRGKTFGRVYCNTVCRNVHYGPRLMMPDAFWARVDRRGPDECWMWHGATISAGYGSFRWTRQHHTAHRFAYELANGPIAEGLLVCHRCDVPGCCNPSHLFAGTYQDNSTDMVRKGRYGPRRNWLQGSQIKTAKLTEAQVVDIKSALQDNVTQTQLARQYGVSVTVIHNIAHGKIWRHVQC